MADTRTPEPDPGAETTAPPQQESRPIQLEDTPLHNPLTPAVRARVARLLTKTGDAIDAGLAAEFDPNEIAALGLDAPKLCEFAKQVVHDVLLFSAARRIQILLAHTENHEMRGAGAALEVVLSAALPARQQALAHEFTRVAAELGFVIHPVGGRGEPLPLPHFAYTEGLGTNASHPELVIVGMPLHAATRVLETLSTSILAGECVVRPGDDVGGVLGLGFMLRIAACPERLAAQMSQNAARPAGALQVLLPDAEGRLPGDPGVDPVYVVVQDYPDYPA